MSGAQHRADAAVGAPGIFLKLLTGLMLLLVVRPVQAQLVAETHSFNGLNQVIPDGDAAGLSDVRTVTSAVANLTGVRVKLHVVGEFNGDLYGYVRHTGVDFTNFCVLLNRLGRAPGNQAGSMNTGLDVVFDDDAALGDIHTCNSITNPAAGTPLTGDWQPDGRRVDPAVVTDGAARTTSLSSFKGVSPSGQWTLFLADLEAGGTNQLVGWELEFMSRATVSGTVRYYPTNYPPSNPSIKTVGDAMISLGGDTNLSTLTLNDGSFGLAGVAGGGTYVVTPGKTNDSPTGNGVSTLDIALIRQHILSPGSSSLTTPYKLLAADVNGSATVSTLDIALIRQLILGGSTQFPAGLWRFVPADYVFPNTNAPWNAPTGSWHANLINDLSGVNFLAIKLGDVNDSWRMPVAAGSTVANRDSVTEASGVPTVNFQASRRLASPGQRIHVPVSVRGFEDVTSVQFTLEWNPGVLRYVGVEHYGLSGLSAGNHGLGRTAEGKLAFSWNDPGAAGVTLAERTAMFGVTFEVIGRAGSMSPIALTDSPTLREVSVNLAAAVMETENGEVRVGDVKNVLVSEPLYREGEFRLSVSTEMGRRYSLEFTDQLPGTNWIALPAVAGDGQALVLTDPAATHQQRFYRVRVE